MTSEIKLHPLVLLNISDHHTRSKLIHDQVVQSVGALMGVQQGRIIQLNNSFEIPLTKDGIDKEFIVKKLELYKQVFPELDFMGWYTTAETDLNSFNQKFSEWNESPIVLVLDPLAMTKDLPVKMYESNVDLNSGDLITSPTHYRIETTDAERIGIDHAVHSSNAGDAKEINRIAS